MAVPKKYWVPATITASAIIIAAIISKIIILHNPIYLPPGSRVEIIAPYISPIQETVIGRGPSPAVLSPEEEKLYYEARNLKEAGVYTDALKRLDELISKRPDYVNAYIVRGRIYFENLGQYQNAIKDFTQALRIEPDNKYALYDLGLTYHHLGELSQAILWNQKALNQDPNLIPAIYNHAIYNMDYGEKLKDTTYYIKAIDLYKEVILRNKEFATWAMFNLAALYARLFKEERNQRRRDYLVGEVVRLLDTFIEREGFHGFKEVTGELHVAYVEDLEAISNDPRYKNMIEKWRGRFNLK